MVSNGRFWRCGMPITVCLRIKRKEGSALYRCKFNMCNKVRMCCRNRIHEQATECC